MTLLQFINLHALILYLFWYVYDVIVFCCRSPQWYTAVSLSHLLAATVPIFPEVMLATLQYCQLPCDMSVLLQVKGVLNSLLPYLEAALKTDR